MAFQAEADMMDTITVPVFVKRYGAIMVETGWDIDFRKDAAQVKKEILHDDSLAVPNTMRANHLECIMVLSCFGKKQIIENHENISAYIEHLKGDTHLELLEPGADIEDDKQTTTTSLVGVLGVNPKNV